MIERQIVTVVLEEWRRGGRKRWRFYVMATDSVWQANAAAG